jgi:hypothetical protein
MANCRARPVPGTFAITQGWTGPPVTISRQYGAPGVWPGATFGISSLPGNRTILSWGSAVSGSPNSEIVAVAATG